MKPVHQRPPLHQGKKQIKDQLDSVLANKDKETNTRDTQQDRQKFGNNFLASPYTKAKNPSQNTGSNKISELRKGSVNESKPLKGEKGEEAFKKPRGRELGSGLEYKSELSNKPYSIPNGRIGRSPDKEQVIALPQKCFEEPVKRSNLLAPLPGRRGKLDSPTELGYGNKKVSVFVANGKNALANKPSQLARKESGSVQNLDDKGLQRMAVSENKNDTRSVPKYNIREKLLGGMNISNPTKIRNKSPMTGREERSFSRERKETSLERKGRFESKLSGKKLPNPPNPTLISPRHLEKVSVDMKLSSGKKRPVLVLFDHDLGFIKDRLLGLQLPFQYTFDKLEHYSEEHKLTKSDKKPAEQAVFVFIKFSPRVKRQSLKALQALVKAKECFVIKCLLDVESVDLNLDYENEAITAEKKKQIEHTLFLERQTFDSFSISDEVIDKLKVFMNAKVRTV